MNRGIRIGLGLLVLGSSAVGGVEHCLESRRESAQKEAAEDEVRNWESYFYSVCKPNGAYDGSYSVHYRKEGRGETRFCSDNSADTIEKKFILTISIGNGSYYTNNGQLRPPRRLDTPSIYNFPIEIGGDFIAVYSAIPTEHEVWNVSFLGAPLPSFWPEASSIFDEEPCYVITSDPITIDGSCIPLCVFKEN